MGQKFLVLSFFWGLSGLFVGYFLRIELNKFFLANVLVNFDLFLFLINLFLVLMLVLGFLGFVFFHQKNKESNFFDSDQTSNTDGGREGRDFLFYFFLLILFIFIYFSFLIPIAEARDEPGSSKECLLGTRITPNKIINFQDLVNRYNKFIRHDANLINFGVGGFRLNDLNQGVLFHNLERGALLEEWKIIEKKGVSLTNFMEKPNIKNNFVRCDLLTSEVNNWNSNFFLGGVVKDRVVNLKEILVGGVVTR